MTTSAPAAVITFEALLDVLLPRDRLPSGVGGACLRLVTGAGDLHPAEAWFARRPSAGWARQQYRDPGERPTWLTSFVRAHPTNLSFSPIPWTGPGGVVAGPACAIWATLSIALDPMPGFPGVARANAGAVAQAHARLAAVPLPPSLVIDAGDSLTAFWLAAEPITDLLRLTHLNHLLGTRLRGHWKPAESLTGSLVPVPGTRNTALLPAADVAITTWAGREYALAALLAAVGG